MNTDTIIVDLDGTLALERHRRPMILKGWSEYFSHIHLDPINKSVLELLNKFSRSHRILIFTSRPDAYRQQTIDWLTSHNVPYDKLCMRSAEDTETGSGVWQNKKSDEDVKLHMIATNRTSPSSVLCVLEDRDAMVDFYRRLGFDCWQVHPEHEMYEPEVKAHPSVQNV